MRATSTESYVYDSLQRLTTDTRSSGSVNYQYDAVGNLMSKSDYSTATYGAYTYGGTRPNAVTSVNLLAGSSASYVYDGNGNVIGGALTESYDANNQARQITRGYGTVNFYYGVGGARYREVSGTQTTIFGAEGYERTTSGGATTHRHELGPVVFTRVGLTTTPTFMLRDRLGSVLTATDIHGAINSNASGVEQRSYDPFGKVRQGNFSDAPPGTLNLQPVTLRGFTGQEHQDDVKVIHMNGRIYDYQLGRFLGVDPIIGNPLSSQSMNPYSYIGNNPLSGKDPTGYQSFPCNGDQQCQATENANFLAGAVGKLLASLSYGGAPSNNQPGGNGAAGLGQYSILQKSHITVGAIGNDADTPNGNPMGIGYNGGGCNALMDCHKVRNENSEVGFQATAGSDIPLLPGAEQQELSTPAPTSWEQFLARSSYEVHDFLDHVLPPLMMFQPESAAGDFGMAMATVTRGPNVVKSAEALWPAASEGRTVINGIEYTIHALERMQPVGTLINNAEMASRGVPVSVVENAIKYGTISPGKTASEVVRIFENVRVITNPEGTRVITVIKTGG